MLFPQVILPRICVNEFMWIFNVCVLPCRCYFPSVSIIFFPSACCSSVFPRDCVTVLNLIWHWGCGPAGCRVCIVTRAADLRLRPTSACMPVCLCVHVGVCLRVLFCGMLFSLRWTLSSCWLGDCQEVSFWIVLTQGYNYWLTIFVCVYMCVCVYGCRLWV